MLNAGACVGAVEAAAAVRGVSRILSVEMDATNYHVLVKNCVSISKAYAKKQRNHRVASIGCGLCRRWLKSSRTGIHAARIPGGLVGT